jgi:hypothetical protein
VAIVILVSCTFEWRSDLKTVRAGGRLAANAAFSPLDDVADAGKEHVAAHAPNLHSREDERLGMPFDVAIASVPGSWPSTAPRGRFSGVSGSSGLRGSKAEFDPKLTCGHGTDLLFAWASLLWHALVRLPSR